MLVRWCRVPITDAGIRESGYVRLAVGQGCQLLCSGARRHRINVLHSVCLLFAPHSTVRDRANDDL